MHAHQCPPMNTPHTGAEPPKAAIPSLAPPNGGNESTWTTVQSTVILRSALRELAQTVRETEKNDRSANPSRLAIALLDARVALSLTARDPVQAKFLLVALDAEGHGQPQFCADEEQLRSVLARRLYPSSATGALDSQQQAHLAEQLALLLEDEGLFLEGEPPITLYKLNVAMGAASRLGTSV